MTADSLGTLGVRSDQFLEHVVRVLAFETDLAEPRPEALRPCPTLAVAVSIAEQELRDLMAHAEQILLRCSACPHEISKGLAVLVVGNLDAEQATIVSCDRLGFVVRACTNEGMKGLRIAFPEEVRSSADARRVFMARVNTARSGV